MFSCCVGWSDWFYRLLELWRLQGKIVPNLPGAWQHTLGISGLAERADPRTPGGEPATQRGPGQLQGNEAGWWKEKENNQKIVSDESPFLSFPGEPFSQEEMEEMLSAAIDPESNSIHYKDYIAMMVVDDS